MSDTGTMGSKQSLGIGEIIGQGFSLTFKNFFQLLLITIVPLIVMAGVAYLLFGEVITAVMVDPTAAEQVIQSQGTNFLVMYLLFIVIAVLIYSFIYAAVIKAIFDARSGRGVNVGSAFSTGVSRSVQLFVTSLVLGILLAIVFLVVQLVVGLIAAALPPEIGVILAVIVILPFTLYIYGMFAPFAAVVVVENLWFSAISRTMALTKGYRWWIVLMLFLLGLAMLVLYLIFILLFYVFATMGQVGMIITAVLGLVLMVLMTGILVGALTVLYTRLRDIKEGVSGAELANVFD